MYITGYASRVYVHINFEKHDLNQQVEQNNLTLMRALASINFVNFENSSPLKIVVSTSWKSILKLGNL